MSKNFKIGRVKFSEKKCVIIAEAGVNHNGSFKIAERLIKEAKLAGADIIKFQTLYFTLFDKFINKYVEKKFILP